MLADPQVEAVVIATADQFHVPLSLQALAAGKHVFVEKPLGTSVEECEELRRAVADSGCTLQVGHMKRFDPGIAFARQFIREEMGSLLALKAWYCDSTYRYTMTDNLQPLPLHSEQARKPAGDPKGDKRRYFMLTHGSHLIDLARFFGGPRRGRARPVQRDVRGVFLVRRSRIRQRRAGASRLDGRRAHGLPRGLSHLRRARQRPSAKPTCRGF